MRWRNRRLKSGGNRVWRCREQVVMVQKTDCDEAENRLTVQRIDCDGAENMLWWCRKQIVTMQRTDCNGAENMLWWCRKQIGTIQRTDWRCREQTVTVQITDLWYREKTVTIQRTAWRCREQTEGAENRLTVQRTDCDGVRRTDCDGVRRNPDTVSVAQVRACLDPHPPSPDRHLPSPPCLTPRFCRTPSSCQ